MVVHHFKYVIKLQNTETSLDAFYWPTVLCSLTRAYSATFPSSKHFFCFGTKKRVS